MNEEKKTYKYDVKLDTKTVLDSHPLNSILTKNVTIISSIWQNNETRYSIYMAEEDNVGRFKISGVFPAPLIINGEYEIQGYISIYKGEKQLTCKSYKLISASTKDGIKQYLSTFDNMYLHIDDIYNAFKNDVIKIMRNSPEKVVQNIFGVDITLALKWQLKIKEDEEIEASMAVLNSFGLSLKNSRDILQKYGSSVVHQLKENPYFLVGEIPSMTFKKCDRIAIENGYNLNNLGRGQQAFIYLFELLSDRGDCYIKKEELLPKCVETLIYSIGYNKCKSLLKQSDDIINYKAGKTTIEIKRDSLQKSVSNYESSYKKSGKKGFEYILYQPSAEYIENCFEILIQSNKIVEIDNKCYLSEIYNAEKYIAEKIYKISQNVMDLPKNINLIDDYLNTNKVILEKEQDKAVREITEKMGGFYIINGGPGCGKTFIIKIIIEILKLKYKANNLDLKIKLLAPTGRAAKVLRDITGFEASTLHRILEYKEDGSFSKNEDDVFTEDLIIVDESSMLDILMTEALFRAVSSKTKVVLIGDTDQLPPIGPGYVLKDIIKSNVININTLQASKRQLNKSTIISNAKNIVSGEMIKSDVKRNDFIVLKKDSELNCKDAIIKGIHELVDKQNYTIEDIQVLVPQKSGILGSTMLNYYIQEIFNPKKEGEEEIFKQKVRIKDSKTKKNREMDAFFRINDKVMHIKNNYYKDWYVKDDLLKFRKEFSFLGVMNGECGIIRNIEKVNELGVKKERITVEYDGGYVFYEDDFSELEHSFVITIHKSQGSQWPAVIIPIFFSNNITNLFFTNNLIYTACTRCEKIGIVIGNPKDMLFAIKNRIENNRNTSLAEFLQKSFVKNKNVTKS